MGSVYRAAIERYLAIPAVPYGVAESSKEWQSYLFSLDKSKRHSEACQRRVRHKIALAESIGLCMFCWMDKEICMCATLATRAKTLAATPTGCAVTVLFHADEFMRQSNTGHVLAALLDANILIWGVHEDNTALRRLSEDPSVAVLFPGDGATVLGDFLKERHKVGAEPTVPCAETPPVSAGTVADACSSPPDPLIHLLVIDGTWHQACSLVRHLPTAIPYVVLNIDAEYDCLFKHLRKQTREIGVSTLEATSFALQEVARFTASASNADAQVRDILSASMKEFVDLCRMVKCTPTVHGMGAEDQTKMTSKIRSMSMRRQKEAEESAAKRKRDSPDPPEERPPLLPPVVVYCYGCDKFIKPSRMVAHVDGNAHKEALRRNPGLIPSEASRKNVNPYRT